jgi:hypothetical protein
MNKAKKEEKIIPLIDVLTERTKNEKISWIHYEDDAYKTSFKDETIEFTYQFKDYDDSDPDASYILIFINSSGVSYEAFYSVGNTSPGFQNFKSLYNAIIEAEEKNFLKRYDAFMAEEK